MIAIAILSTSSFALRIEGAKQVTVDTGWVATGNRLFWTTDAGGTWKDITPPQLPRVGTPLKGMSAVLFLDGSKGWVVIHSYSEDPDVDTNQIFIATTNDAGANWSYRRVSTPDIDHAGRDGSHGLSENVSIQFTDALHGIMNVEYATGSAFTHFAASVVTSDGGNTWQDLGAAPGGPLLFTTQSDGWIAGDEALFVTHDRGRNWAAVRLPTPAGLPKEALARYELPIFPDKDHGFLVVGYSGAAINLTVLFSSLDGGRTWRQDKALSGVQHGPFGVLNFDWRTLSLMGHNLIVSSPLKSSSPSSAPVDANLAYLYTTTFLDVFHGWALMGVQGDGPDQLLSTSDSGASWSIITPPAIKGNVVGHTPRVKTPPLIWKPQSTVSPIVALDRVFATFYWHEGRKGLEFGTEGCRYLRGAV
jgi:hypothetical protein